MRVAELEAVDIVDAGAITPDGFFLSVGVDSNEKYRSPKTEIPMATAPTVEQLMEQVGNMAKALTECQAAIAKMATPPTPAPAGDETLKAIKLLSEQMGAVSGLKDQLTAVTKTVTDMKRERALLGFRGTDADRVKLSGASVEDIETFSKTVKTYPELVAEFRKANETMSASDAHDRVRGTAEGREAYRQHLFAKGVINREQMSAA